MILDQFHSRVTQAPDAIAVQDGDRRLTYLTLARHAAGLAARLTRRGVRPGDVVAVYADRSAEIVVAELAVLLAGAAYVPLDPAHPSTRTTGLLGLSGAAAVITTRPLLSAGAELGDPEVVDLAQPPAGCYEAVPQPADDALAYVIFTSGSTGRPKAAAVRHGGLANLMRWHENAFGLGERDRTTLLCAPGFDVSVWDTWPTLAAGGTLVVPPAAVRASPPDLVAWLADERITAAFLPTPLAEAVLDVPWPAHTALRWLHTGGSALQRGMPPGLPFTLVNVYGPAECTVVATTAVVPPGGPVPPPIGVPLDGVRCYVLDGFDVVPDGTPGEMCLAGACLARGYLDDPAATARSFVPDVAVPGQRMYRTGDLVRRRPDGTFEYLGRLDDQVKIRGFRIEPGEIAAVLRQHPAVRESYVAARRTGSADPVLHAYVAADATPAELIAFVAARLPGYMVPAAVVVLPALPMTANDKVDRAALPAPDRVAAGLAAVAAPQRTPTQGAVARIVSDLLGGVAVGADDDFFALGGTSLLVGRLSARIAVELGAKLSLAELARARTIAAFADLVDERTGRPQVDTGLDLDSPIPPTPPPITRADRSRPIPLSFQQRRVWFFAQLAPGNIAYNFQATVSLRGDVDTAALRAALDEIVRRHEMLRTTFVSVDGVAVQQPVASMGAPLRVLDVPREQADDVVVAELAQPFDLTSAPLARWLLLRHGGGENTFVHVEHHFIHDGWSLAVFLSELSALYPAFAAGQPSPLPELAVQYADYAIWQREWMDGEVLKAHVNHWTTRLAGASDRLELPADHPRPPVVSLRGAAPRIKVPAELARALRAFSRQHRVSLFSTMYAAFAALLHRYTGQQDLLVGTGMANRSLPELQPLLGMIVNTVVLRTRPHGRMSFTDLLDQVQETVLDALAWSDTPLDTVIDAIGPERDSARLPLFQVMFSFHDSAVPDLDFGGLTGAVTERANGSAKADLNVIVVPRGAQRVGRESRPEDDDLNLIWEYSTDLFDASTMSRMVEHYLNLLADALARPDTAIGGLRLMPDDESRRLQRWSRGPAVPAAEPGRTIPALFAAQVAIRPDATALLFGTESMTYAELDRRSNALAMRLRRRGVVADVPVAVAIERGPDLVVALLAVSKAGGAYLPIDAGSPAPRVAAMVAAAGARLLLATRATDLTGIPGVDTVCVDAGPIDAADERTPPPDLSHPDSLAYISFTSGSTGVPKGVAVPHRGVVRLVHDPSFAPLGPGQRLLHLAPVAFDASTWELWGALLTGATTVIAPPGPLGLPEIAALLRSADVTVAWLTAGLFHQLAEADVEAVAGVPVLLAGGDALNPATVRAVLSARGRRPLVNGYGPTENTTFTTCHVMTDPDQVASTVPIGRPIQGTTVHLFDESGQPVPVGVTGELFTGGDGLARGYVGNASATARAFVPDPHGCGTRLYRTGDLARWRADGTLEFVGRADDQIKIRGFRVEPGEVASVLRAHPDVADAVVLVAGQGVQRHLIAYMTPADGADLGTLRPASLRDFLLGRLPEYLVPTGFKVLDRFPLNANGKIDRAALPAPEVQTRGPITPPRGETEERLADVWRRLLPAGGPYGDDIGREDSFFALGGNSLLASRLMFRIREVFDVELRMATFYEKPTLVDCAAAIDAARDRAATGPARPATIGRQDRRAFRARAPQPPPGRKLAPHLVHLGGDWALWRTVCLRAAGFPAHLLAGLGAADLAAAADAVVAVGEQARAAYSAEFTAAVRRQCATLHEAASRPALREAVAWQNRHALTTGLDPVVRRGPEPAKRDTKARQHEALIASYLQRYCAKNDTIGFFGPVSWSRIDDGAGVRITHDPAGRFLADRITYLEGWAVAAILAEHTMALRPWLVPRRMPFVGLDGTQLRVPLAPPVPLTPAEAAVLRAVDGGRDAGAVAERVLADGSAGLRDVDEVFAVLARLADQRRLAWQVEISPPDIHPERTMRALLARVTDDDVRAAATRALDELTAARDELAGAAGDPEGLAAAMAGLEATFTRLAGVPPTRRAGELYAGRTVAYEECRRADTVRFGADTLDGIREALALVLDSARWFVGACAEVYTGQFEAAYRKRAAALGTDVVPFADFWLLVNDALFHRAPTLIQPAVAALQEHWSAILDLPEGSRRVQLRSADLRRRAAGRFPAPPRPWPTAVFHSPDLMIAGADAAAGGRLTWVLGEVHPSKITARYGTWLELHDDPGGYHAAMRHDLAGPVVWQAETAEISGSATRQAGALVSPGDRWLVWSHDANGYDPASTLAVGDCDVIDSPTGLRVRHRDGTFERDLLPVLGDLIMSVIINSFDPVPPAAHTPRVTIDDLVVGRERWTFAATDLAFAATADESSRYLQARAWVTGHGLPRHVFLRFAGERKPIYADLTSLASIDLISRSVRRCRHHGGAEATVTVVEMLPEPDQTWLVDADGRRYTSELRLVAVDQMTADQSQEG
ncbi:amino acid adenylation domain-containing protein [Micromonospora sp. NPDC049836]|uniref:amino acid adenylation domain-containing protein n=1 Tax=Micromonospora sp. NPDC049836 TaxID=3364274 RepID=UPI0037BB64ED